MKKAQEAVVEEELHRGVKMQYYRHHVSLHETGVNGENW